MFRLRDLIVQNRTRLAEVISRENGKTIPDALGEVARGLENVEFACGIPNLLKGGYTEQASRGVDVYQIRQPIGVVAGITPFNFPAMVPLWMLSTPSPAATHSSSSLRRKFPAQACCSRNWRRKRAFPTAFSTWCRATRLPLTACSHPEIKAISFVGSTPVAKYIYETATRNGKRVQALGGAKNHMLVLPDADIAMAADAAVSAAYGAAGERCMAISVVLAVGSWPIRSSRPFASALRASKSAPALSRKRDGPAHHPRASRPRRQPP
jgi:malonate-semialdehyde dehydrogenase (acetylating)/methylmalonate-semialdehyde dehydrogenase